MQARTHSHMHTCLCMTTESRGHPWVAAGISGRSSYGVHNGWRGMWFPEICTAFICAFTNAYNYLYKSGSYKNLFLKSLIFKELEKE